MKQKIRSEEEFNQALWNIVWKKANRICEENKPGKPVSIAKLALEIGVPVLTITRWIEKKETKQPFSWRSGIRLLLAKYAGFKDFEAFKKWVLAEEEKKGEAHLRIMQIIKEDRFLEKVFELLIQASFTTNDKVFTADDADLFFRLIKSLHTAYTTETPFTSLSIVADTSSIIGNISMKDYFIQLSYVTKSEIATRESLVKNETELTSIKIRRSIENNQQLTKDYIINFSLKNIQKILVLGNPGVGKSTFCRWLCNVWSQDPDITRNVVPIYIQLKGLEFQSGRNAILDYIYRNYLIEDGSVPASLHGVLKKVHPFVCFILDGYDELSGDQKKMLFLHLGQISSGCKYILASRPYGVLGNSDYKYDQLLQLDGFDTANINNYIDTFLQKNAIAKDKTKEQLLEIINLNPTLTDFAHNPLMLSFIVYIYLSDADADEILRKIQTRFDLQQAVIGWMFVHNKAKTTAELTPQLIEAISRIALQMEFDKTAEKTGDLFDKDRTAVLLPVSELGLGQLTKYNLDKYKFYFNSITFQEYFASIPVANKITSSALEYILRDSYFWNLAAMVIGQISNESTSSLMGNLLSACEDELGREENDYSYYKYILLLSECRTQYLNTRLSPSTLQTINKAAAKICAKYNENGHLKYAFAECVQRIYNKMDECYRAQFKELLLDRMELSWKNPNDPLLKWDASCYHLPTLVKYLDLNLDVEFTTRCIDLLAIALEELKQGLHDESALWDLPDFVVAILQNNPEDFFLLTRPHLEKVIELLPPPFLNFKAKIELHNINAQSALIRLSNSIHSFNDSKAASEKLLGQIAVYVYVLGKRSKDLEKQKDIDECQYNLFEGAEIVHNYLSNRDTGYDPDYINTVRPIVQLVTEGLFESKFFEINFPKAIDILAGIDDEYLFFDQATQVTLYNYFDKIVANTLLNNDDTGLNRICTMIYCIPGLKSKIAFHRNEIVQLVNSYIRSNSTIFHQQYPESHVNYFWRLLEREEQAIFESDRRFFVEIMLASEAGKLPFFKKNLIPRVMQKQLVIYSPLYWDFILSFLDENEEQSIHTALSIFANSSIYEYATNLPYLQKLFSFLLRIKSQPYYQSLIKSQAEQILVIISNTLKMIKEANIVSRNMLNQVIPFTGAILKDEFIKSEVKDKLVKSRRNGACNAAYVLQYYFTNDIAFDLNIDYWEALPKNNQKSIIEFICPAFARYGTLPEDETAKIRKVTGEGFIKALYTQLERIEMHQFPFSKEKFISLCEI